MSISEDTPVGQLDVEGILCVLAERCAAYVFAGLVEEGDNQLTTMMVHQGNRCACIDLATVMQTKCLKSITEAVTDIDTLGASYEEDKESTDDKGEITGS